MKKRAYNSIYRGDHLNRVAFPLGGLGAGMVALEGTGALSHFSVRHRPDVFNEPYMYAALCIKGTAGNTTRVLEGPVPKWKLFGTAGAGNGLGARTYGLPRFASATFQTRFPFGIIKLRDPQLPVEVELTGWSPFIPGNADDSSLPLALLEYKIKNRSAAALEAVFSFNAKNPMLTKGCKSPNRVAPAGHGIVLSQEGSPEAPWEAGQFYAGTDAPGAVSNCGWFRGGWFDAQTMAWKDAASGLCVSRAPHAEGPPSSGGSLYVPLALAAGASATVRLVLAWHVPVSAMRCGAEEPAETCAPGSACACDKAKPPAKPPYVPWYAGRFADVAAVADYAHKSQARLRRESARFSRCFYDTTLPPELVDAAAANLTILKSPTVLRQADGRLWAWEGCADESGCCHGSCTHVWNYAQAVPHLFPDLERSLRETEFQVSQDERGHQTFRASLPIRPTDHKFHAAADGQLGGIMKVHREWRIGGNTEWLRGLWPEVRKSLDYCIETWDPDRQGALFEPHHNTYDIEFWGPDGMCTSFYLGALKAAVAMGEALGDDVAGYRDLLARGLAFMEKELYDGDFYIQKIQWKGLRAADPTASIGINSTAYTTEAKALLDKEGPKYQYGSGCLTDGILGAWLGVMCGVDPFLDPAREKSHLAAIHRHNFKRDLSAHVNPQRPTFAAGDEGGLLLCSWPKGGALALPFVYSDEVWTGIEYQAAGHMILRGLVQEGLEVVRACRDRYDGRTRNPFNEYECGHWYARAMASYGLLQAYGGVRYDAVTKTLHVAPAVKGDVRVFLATATGYGAAGVRDGKPFLEVVSGTIEAAPITAGG